VTLELSRDEGMAVVLDKVVVVEALRDVDWALRVRHELLQRQILVAALDAVDAVAELGKQ